jgi:hypothetical protein
MIHVHTLRDDVLAPRSANETSVDVAALLISSDPLQSHRTFAAYLTADGLPPSVIMYLVDIFGWPATSTGFHNMVLMGHPQRPVGVTLTTAAFLTQLMPAWQVSVAVEQPQVNREQATADLIQLCRLAETSRDTFEQELVLLRTVHTVTKEALKEKLSTVVRREQERGSRLSQQARTGSTSTDSSSDDSSSGSSLTSKSKSKSGSRPRSAPRTERLEQSPAVNRTAGALRPDLQRTLGQLRETAGGDRASSSNRGVPPGRGLKHHKVVKKTAENQEAAALARAQKKREQSTSGAATAATSGAKRQKTGDSDDIQAELEALRKATRDA